MLDLTSECDAASAAQVVRAAAGQAPEPAPEPASQAAADEESSDDDEFGDFVSAPLPEPPAPGAEVVPPGLTAGSVARRRASLAPQVRTCCCLAMLASRVVAALTPKALLIGPAVPAARTDRGGPHRLNPVRRARCGAPGANVGRGHGRGAGRQVYGRGRG